MKKRILAVAAACAAVLCMSACGAKTPQDETGTDEYAELNDMLAMHYSQIELTVTNTFGEELALVSKYQIRYSDGGAALTYSIERFAEVSLDAPASAVKTTLCGEAEIRDGTVTIVSGQYVDLNANIAERGFDFKKDYFGTAEKTGMYLKADVSDASGFMGAELTCTDMKVSATFLDFFYDMEITYRAEDGNLVELLYVFTL